MVITPSPSGASGGRYRGIFTRPTMQLARTASTVQPPACQITAEVPSRGSRLGPSTTGRSTNGGSPVAGFLLGAVSSGSVDRRTVSSWYPRQTVWALHANDSWKMTTKFTINVGLRWDYYTPSREKYNHFSFVDLSGANPDAGNLLGRLAFAGHGYGTASYGAQYPEKPWHNGFAPRLVAAYAIDQKTVVRAGYGVFFAQAFYPGWGGGMSLDGFNLHQT